MDDPNRMDVDKGATVGDVAGGVTKGLVGCLLLPFQPLLVISALIFRGRSPKEKQVNYVVRVNCVDGGIRVARFDRELRKATIAAGDYVSIWGEQRAGVVKAYRAYNHSVSAEIL